ncbi:MAG: CheR family methyltransferase [Chloroflexota bacterium]|nr:CheR family methyltransferase [Chloroflexota bacterium]
MAFTYFFRDQQTLDLIAQHVVPDLKRHRYINVWDAGCAMGPEPYSIAIIFRENMGPFLFRNVRVHATDIDESDRFGAIITRGVYSKVEVKRIPPEILSKYFSPNGKEGYFQISDEIRKAVAFERHDLLSLEPIREGFGLIVCKNVLLHLQPHERVDVINMFHHALSEGGYFATEQTQKLPPETGHLFRRVTDAGQLFQKVGKGVRSKE